MRRKLVWINFQPKLYSEILKAALESLALSDAVIAAPFDPDPNWNMQESDSTDIVLLSLDNLGKPQLDWTPERMRQSRMIAFSPDGDYGLMRSPGETSWDELRPFGIKELINLLSTV